jgi:hypothetical protein
MGPTGPQAGQYTHLLTHIEAKAFTSRLVKKSAFLNEDTSAASVALGRIVRGRWPNEPAKESRGDTRIDFRLVCKESPKQCSSIRCHKESPEHGENDLPLFVGRFRGEEHSALLDHALVPGPGAGPTDVRRHYLPEYCNGSAGNWSIRCRGSLAHGLRRGRAAQLPWAGTPESTGIPHAEAGKSRSCKA